MLCHCSSRRSETSATRGRRAAAASYALGVHRGDRGRQPAIRNGAGRRQGQSSAVTGLIDDPTVSTVALILMVLSPLPYGGLRSFTSGNRFLHRELSVVPWSLLRSSEFCGTSTSPVSSSRLRQQSFTR